jgi:chromosome segregation ATPase
MQTAGGNKQAAATDDTAIRNSPDEVAKAANSGQNRTHADAPESAIQNPQPAIAEAAKSGQNRTHDDTLAQFAIRNPQSAMEADETTVLRKRALDASEAHIKRINEMEKKALHQAKENNADPGKIAEMRDNFERARQAIDETMEAIDIASLEELRQVCNDPKNPFFDLAMPKSA